MKIKNLSLALLGVLVICGCNADDPNNTNQLNRTPARVPLRTASIDILKDGGYVIYFRHAKREPNHMIDVAAVDRTGACVVGTELNAQGRSDSIKIGSKFAALQILVDRVYASPACRTKQMAKLAFGAHEASIVWELANVPMQAPEDQPRYLEMMQAHLSRFPARGTNTVLLTHGDLETHRHKVAGLMTEGDAAIFRPLGNDFEFVGVVKRDVWVME